MRRTLPLLVTAVALSATVAAGSTLPSAGAAPAAGKNNKVSTHFAFSSTGYGSQVTGGSVPANSDQTAFNTIACTNKAGIHRDNYEAQVKIPGLGVVHGVRTDNWTEKKGETYSAYASHSIARIVLASSGLGSLEIRGVESLARAYHTPSGFKASTETSVAKIVFTPTGGKATTLAIPRPGRPLVVPGLARIALGSTTKTVTKAMANANANALDITAIPLKTRVRVAQSRASITKGIHQGVFKGYSAGLRVAAADDNVRVGRTPLNPLGCAGTGGKKLVNQTAQVDGGDVAQAQGVYAGNVATNFAKVAKGTVAGVVAHAELASGAIKVDGVVAEVNAVRQDGGKVKTNSNGTKVAALTVNGTVYDLKKIQTINIPGLAKIQTGVKEKLPAGLRVIGLRVTLLDGTGAVVDLGVAELQIKKGPDA